MRPTLLIIQDVIARGHDVDAAAAALGWEPRSFAVDKPGLLADSLATLEAETIARDARPVVFCSLQAARMICRRHPALARGLFLNERITRWSVTSAYLPAEWLLNPRGSLLPWAHLEAEAAALAARHGPALFLRPDSAMKAFTGFPVPAHRLAEEVRLHGQTDSILPEELTLVAPARRLGGTEFRFWLVDGRVSDGAPRGAAYGWVHERADVVLDARAPDAAVALAAAVAARLEAQETLLVADIALVEADDDAQGSGRQPDIRLCRPALVELNGFSTSGFYPGLDVVRLLADLEPLLA